MHNIKSFHRLNNNELLAILLGNAASSKLVTLLSDDSPWQKIFQITAEEWQTAGYPTHAWQLIAASKEMQHRFLLEPLKKTKLSASSLVKKFLLQRLKPLKTEVFYLLLLDSASQLLDFRAFTENKPHTTCLNTREIVKITLLSQARYVILGHNHPSGVLKISQADKRATKKLQLALSWIEVEVLDHIIVAGNQTLSFAEKGLI